MDWAPWFAVAAVGGIVGWTELAQRYRDRPTGPLRTWPGNTYILVNILASLGALALVRHLDLGTGIGLPLPVAQVLIAGAGAMAFFRSAFFTVRLRDTDLPLGPAAILQVILNASDRAYDRERAAQRSQAVARIMHDVSFDRAKQALPAYCLQLMQNVSQEEADQLGEELADLEAAAMGPRSKSYNLGLKLLNLVGEPTLETAVKALGAVILMPNEADQRLLDAARDFPPAAGSELLALCRFLDPERDGAAVERLRAEVATILAGGEPDEVKAVAVLGALRGVFGSVVLETALAKRHR